MFLYKSKSATAGCDSMLKLRSPSILHPTFCAYCAGFISKDLMVSPYCGGSLRWLAGITSSLFTYNTNLQNRLTETLFTFQFYIKILSIRHPVI